jgi:hypothetical protein
MAISRSKNPRIGRRQKVPAEYRAEVERLFAEPRPFGWRVYRRDGGAAIMRASMGYASEAEAWSAVGSELHRLETAAKKS